MDMCCGDEASGSVNWVTGKKVGRSSVLYVFTIGRGGPLVGPGEPVSVSKHRQNDENGAIQTKRGFKNVM